MIGVIILFAFAGFCLIMAVCAYQNQTQVKKKNEEKALQRIEYLRSKYPEPLSTVLINRQVFKGMTIENLVDSLGQPTLIETEVLKTKTKCIYVYGNKSSGNIFVFVNNQLDTYKIR